MANTETTAKTKPVELTHQEAKDLSDALWEHAQIILGFMGDGSAKDAYRAYVHRLRAKLTKVIEELENDGTHKNIAD